MSFAPSHTELPCTFDRLMVIPRGESEASPWRLPMRSVHVVDTHFQSASQQAAAATLAYSKTSANSYSDIDVRGVAWDELAAAGAGHGLRADLEAALLVTGVFGSGRAAYERVFQRSIDVLTTRGASFHNDTMGHWPGCLFWVLALDARDLELVLPHAGVRVAMVPGRLVVFDPCLVHGLCRPADDGRAVEASFDGEGGCAAFLAGEIELSGAQWKALGSPWMRRKVPAGALSLMQLNFDADSGAIAA